MVELSPEALAEAERLQSPDYSVDYDAWAKPRLAAGDSAMDAEWSLVRTARALATRDATISRLTAALSAECGTLVRDDWHYNGITWQRRTGVRLVAIVSRALDSAPVRWWAKAAGDYDAERDDGRPLFDCAMDAIDAVDARISDATSVDPTVPE